MWVCHFVYFVIKMGKYTARFLPSFGVIINRKLKMIRQHNDQRKKDNDLQNIVQKTKDRAT
jgi:hypothetical protein